MDLSKRKIIAELGMTHDGSRGQAEAMIAAAAECGVDAIKLQTHISSAETVRNAPTPPYFKAEPRYEYFERTAFSKDVWKELKSCAKEHGVEFISSPFSIEAAELLVEIGVDAIKVPSGEITNIPYLEYLSGCGLPIIVSSGMSSLEEVDECKEILLKNNCNVALMQCTSEYPCGPEHVGLNMIGEFGKRFPNVPIGFSDHSSGVWAAIAAFYAGARIIEKHFTLSKKMYGPDAKMSMEPEEMRLLCDSIKMLEQAMENPVDKGSAEEFSEMKRIFQKSVVAVEEIPAGTVIQKEMLGCKKPGTGLSTRYLKEIVGLTAKRDLKVDDIIMYEDINWPGAS